MDYHRNPNPSIPQLFEDFDLAEFKLSDYLVLEDDGFRDQDYLMTASTISSSPEKFEGNSSEGFVDDAIASKRNTNIEHGNGMKKKKKDDRNRVAFRTKSEQEIMDDGYKWRKYGKKSVKNSPNPRNYYKCSSGNCQVKKRVERDREDSSYVITTYDGVHNHATPLSSSPAFSSSSPSPSLSPSPFYYYN